MAKKSANPYEEVMAIAMQAYDAIYAQGCHNSFKFIFHNRNHYVPIAHSNGIILQQMRTHTTITMHDEIMGGSFTWRVEPFMDNSSNLQAIISCFQLLVEQHFLLLYPNERLNTIIQNKMGDPFMTYLLNKQILLSHLDKPIRDYWRRTQVYQTHLKILDHPFVSTKSPSVSL